MKKHLKTRESLISIPIIAKAVSYRAPLPVTKVIELERRNYFPVCPRCAISMEREYMAFCDRCGQRLSWYAFPFAQVCYMESRRGE